MKSDLRIGSKTESTFENRSTLTLTVQWTLISILPLHVQNVYNNKTQNLCPDSSKIYVIVTKHILVGKLGNSKEKKTL
jgi:hypothetical protein